MEKYFDDTISLQMCIVENGRLTNKYSLVIVGECLLGGCDHNEKILKLPYEYFGWASGFDCSYNNIQVASKHFKSIDEAKNMLQTTTFRKFSKNSLHNIM